MRRSFAIVVVALWIGGMVALWRRHTGTTPEQRLMAGVLRLEPTTYFYTVAQSGTPIGMGSSAIDTIPGGFRSTATVRARTVVYGDSQTVEASARAYLSRAFALDSFSLSLGGDQGPFHMWGKTRGHEGVLLPTVLPIAFMLSGDARVGRSDDFWLFNPLSQRVERVTLRITAESLFHIADSAAFDAARAAWVPAHIDTVRAWSVSPPSGALTAWVDSQGRLVAASEPGGLSLLRTAYEIAALNGRQAPKPPTPPTHSPAK